MKKLFRSGPLIGLCCLLWLTTLKIAAQTPAQTIPDFTFYKLNDNSPFTDKNLTSGEKMLFIFFDVTCIHCQHTISALNSRINECRGISVYLISMDDKLQIEKFLLRYGNNITTKKNVMLLQDLKKMFIRRFLPRKYPSVFLYSGEKKLLFYSDEDQSLDKVFELIRGRS